MPALNEPLPLTGELDLSPFLLSPFYSIHYRAQERQVWKGVHFHADGQSVWGHTATSIPDTVKTLDELLDFMAREDGICRLQLQTPLRLVCTAHGQEICQNSSPIRVGRDASCDLTFPDVPWRGYLSRQHACFVREENQWYLEDLHPTNRTRINNVPVEPGSVTALHPGDRIRFTASSDEFVFEPPLL